MKIGYLGGIKKREYLKWIVVFFLLFKSFGVFSQCSLVIDGTPTYTFNSNNRTISLTYTVLNNGNSAPGTFNAKIYLSTDQTLNINNDDLIYTDTWGGNTLTKNNYPNGYSTTITTNAISNSYNGTYYLFIYIPTTTNSCTLNATRNISVTISNPCSSPSTPSIYNTSSLTSSSVTLNWSAVSGANNYNLIVANNSSFTNPIINSNVGNTTNYSLSGLSSNTTYYYGVKAYNSNCGLYSPWSSAYTFTTLTSCSYSLSTYSNTATSGAYSNVIVSVTANSGCAWNASSNTNWLSVTSGSSGSGNGTVYFNIAENTSSTSRTGTITIAGNTYTLTQSGATQTCSYSLSTYSNTVTAGAYSNVIVSVTANAGCTWSASSNVNWLTITSGSSGSGNGTVYFNIAENTSSTSRTGTITIAGNTYTITQAGVNQICSYTLSNNIYTATSIAYTNISVSVTANAGCTWTASSNTSWLSVTSGSSGSGNGTVYFNISENTSSYSRTGTITIAGNTYTLTQSGATQTCSYSLSTYSNTATAGAYSNVIVSVTANAGCAWSASSNVNWLTITSGSSGSGNGTVYFNIAENTSSTSRTGTITIAGNTYTVIQAGANQICSYTLSNNIYTATSNAYTNISVSVTANAGCTWTASSNTSWLSVTSGSSGSGNGTVYFSIDQNTTNIFRTGTLTIAGKTYTITQDPAPSAQTPILNFSLTLSKVCNGINSTVNLNWTNANTTTFKIYRKVGNGSFTLLSTMNGLSYEDQNPTLRSTNWYKVVASKTGYTDKTNVEGQLSAIPLLTCTTKIVTPITPANPVTIPIITIAGSVNAGQTLQITGSNFTANGNATISILQNNTEVITENITASNTGTINKTLLIPNTLKGIYTLHILDIAKNISTDNKNFNVVNNTPLNDVLNFNVTKTEFTSEEKIPINWTTTISGTYNNNGKGVFTRNYKIEYKKTTETNWTIFKNKITNSGKYNNLINFNGGELNINNIGIYNIRITDLDVTNFILSENITIINTKVDLGFQEPELLWDVALPIYESTLLPIKNPIGVVADGTSKIYIKLTRVNSDNMLPIKSISFQIFNDENTMITQNDAIGIATCGKLKLSSFEEFNSKTKYSFNGTPTQTNYFINSQKLENTYYFQYLAPEDFTQNSTSELGTREIKIKFIITYLNNTEIIKEKTIRIIRPPLVLVHGLNGGDNSFKNFSYLTKNSIQYVFTTDDGLKSSTLYYKYKNSKRLVYPNDASFLLGALNVSSLIDDEIKKCINQGFSTSKVDYVAHSMGGSVARTIINKKVKYFNENNYFEGKINKLITLNTPHNGSPIASLLTKIFNLNYPSILPFLSQFPFKKIVKPEVDIPINAFFKFCNDCPNLISTSDAMMDLQTDNGIKFKSTTIKNHLFGTKLINDLVFIKSISTSIFGINLFGIFFLNNSKIEQNLIGLNKLFASEGYYDFFPNSDIVVPFSSQLANTNQNLASNSFFEGPDYYHPNVTELTDIGTVVFNLLNSPINSNLFADNIPANPNAVSGNIKTYSIDTPKTYLDSIISYYDTNYLKIISPQNRININIDSPLKVQIELRDTTGFKRLVLICQNEFYNSDTNAYLQEFSIPLKYQALGLTPITVIGYFDSAGYSIQRIDTIQINTFTQQTLQGIMVDPQVKNVSPKQIFTINTNAIYSNLISSLADNAVGLSVSINDTNIVTYYNQYNLFKAKDTGSTYIIFYYNGYKDSSLIYLDSVVPTTIDTNFCNNSLQILNIPTKTININLSNWKLDSISFNLGEKCTYIVRTNVDWISFKENYGVGSGKIYYTVSTNPSTQARIGKIYLNNDSILINQTGSLCYYILDTNLKSYTANAQNDSFFINSNCNWTVTTNSSWINISSSNTNAGATYIKYSITANNELTSRTGGINVGGQIFTITQNFSCPTNKTPIISRVSNNLTTDIPSLSLSPINYNKQVWYESGTQIAATLNNMFSPINIGIYTVIGFDSANNCATNLSKKYYYATTCITPTGRIGNGASIEGNVIDNPSQIVIKWCPEILKNFITILALDINGNKVLQQKVPANLGTYILFKNTINATQYFIQVLDENNELVQLSDVVNIKN